MRKRQRRKPPSSFRSLKWILFAFLFFAFLLLILVTQRTNEPFPHILSRGKHPSHSKVQRKTFPSDHLMKEPTSPSNTLTSPTPIQIDRKKRIAIVIDDVGYDLSLLQRFLQLDVPLTFSILPNLPYSTASAKLARKAGKTVILHMPMQPEREVTMDDSFITVDLSPSEVASKIEKALRSVPGAVGVSNHMGSLATQKEEIMNAVMSTLAKHNLFFLDSLTTSNSVGVETALKAGVQALKRDVFIDNKGDPQYILGQMEQLASLALKKGEAIGIGHLKETTLEGITLALPHLEEKGIEVVPLTELLR